MEVESLRVELSSRFLIWKNKNKLKIKETLVYDDINAIEKDGNCKDPLNL